tara:strand:+ start:790 stop:1257 length:468 start_codon:yes stop_codon:yes gene_type:complete
MKFLIKIFLLIMLTHGCGFKVIKQSELIDFYISEIETIGDNKINYDLKNKLIYRANDEDKKRINLKIITKKVKTVKEKNTSNEITKYEINIQLKININHNYKQINILNLSDKINYNVSKQYSQTINNENVAIKSLTNGLVDKIIREISLLNLDEL